MGSSGNSEISRRINLGGDKCTFEVVAGKLTTATGIFRESWSQFVKLLAHKQDFPEFSFERQLIPQQFCCFLGGE